MTLNDLSLKELKDLLNRVDTAIATFEDRKKLETLAKLHALAKADGFKLEELIAWEASQPKKRAPSTKIYVNPGDPTDTWSGRGRKPRWFIEAVAAGKKPTDLLLGRVCW